MRPTVRAVAAVALLVAVLGACSNDDDNDVSSTATTTTTAASNSTTTTTALEGASTTRVSIPATKQVTALLADVRAARQAGFDRVVFEFTNSTPGYAVGYIDRPVTQDGSGEEVTVRGDHVLQVRMENALDADLTKESAPRTYTGPNRLSPSTTRVAELVGTGAFEGVLTWVVGLTDKAGFKVSTLPSPPRLIIDIAHQ